MGYLGASLLFLRENSKPEAVSTGAAIFSFSPKTPATTREGMYGCRAPAHQPFSSVALLLHVANDLVYCWVPATN